MANITNIRNTRQYGDRPIPDFLPVPVAAGVILYQGTMVSVGGPTSTNAGYLQPVTVPNPTGGQRIVGRIEKTIDNSGGLAGARVGEPHQGVFDWDNGTAADLIGNANIGAPCYAIDNHTVGLTDGGATRPFAGIIQFVDADSGRVWVEQRVSARP